MLKGIFSSSVSTASRAARVARLELERRSNARRKALGCGAVASVMVVGLRVVTARPCGGIVQCLRRTRGDSVQIPAEPSTVPPPALESWHAEDPGGRRRCAYPGRRVLRPAP